MLIIFDVDKRQQKFYNNNKVTKRIKKNADQIRYKLSPNKANISPVKLQQHNIAKLS